MRTWFGQLDRILRGDATSLPVIRDGTIHVNVAGLSIVLLVLAAIYGMCMGWFGLFNRVEGPDYKQMFSSMAKVPLLFFLTLVVTFPSLYVFNALVGSRLTLSSLSRLMVAAMAVTISVLASFGPIVAFFSVTTKDHAFILLLNVFVCAVAGLLGMMFLLQTLHRLTVVTYVPDLVEIAQVESPKAGDSGGADESDENNARLGYDEAKEGVGPLDALKGHVLGTHVKKVFNCWVIVFALVGAQMSWVLRPFIGKPDEPFKLFAPRESNFFQSVWESLSQLLA